MSNLKLFPFMRRLDKYDLDDTTLESGIYGFNNTGGGGMPENDSTGITTKIGMILIFNGKSMSMAGNPIVQIAFGYNNTIIRIRTNWVGKWYEWKNIPLT